MMGNDIEKQSSDLCIDVDSTSTPSVHRGESSRQALVSTTVGEQSEKDQEVLRVLRDAKKSGDHAAAGGNPFAFNPPVMDKLLNPKNLDVFSSLGGLNGLEIGLRTDRNGGLSVDEDVWDDEISFEDVRVRLAGTSDAASALSPRLLKGSKSRMSRASVSPGKRTGFSDRRRVFKDNSLPSAKAKSFLSMVWAAYNDKVLMVLTAAAVVSLAIGLYQTFDTPRTSGNPPIEWVEGVAIIVAIVVIVLVGSINDYQKEQQFLRLSKKSQSHDVTVIRSGRTQRISVFDVLVGDVIHLEPGDVAPADGVFIDGHNIQCDESLVTGESDLIAKYPADEVLQAMQDCRAYEHLDPFIISGSKVAEGIGTYLVTATGIHSSYGKILASLDEDPQVTPLQVRLDKLAKQISIIGAVLALVMFIILFIKFLVQLPHDGNTSTQRGQHFLNVLIIALTVLVIAVPEGLPLAVTLSLAFATTKMIRDHNLVRRLKSCETMGNVTTVCSDKTGTLTRNEMKVVVGTIGSHFQFTDQAGDNTTNLQERQTSFEKENFLQDTTVARISYLSERLCKDVRKLLEHLIAINTTAFENDNGDEFIGSRTETALLSFARSYLGMGPLGLERSNATIVYLVPFHALHQCMATVVKLNNGVYRLYVKGAPELLLTKCTRIIANPFIQLGDVPITSEDTKVLQNLIKNYASRSLRTIGLMYRDFDHWPPIYEQTEIKIDHLLSELVFLAIVGIQDPLRPEVKDAVLACQRAGVVVRMVTGDNIWTARAIAKESGILTTDGEVMEGARFRNLSEVQMDEIIPRLQVLARASPEDKRVLVTHLKKLGGVVASTGDGTNDAPALASADIGISMGESGTEIAKEAADIILLDDNFASIVKAIMWGRAINDAVKKFLQFQITVSVTSVGLAFITAVSNSSETSVLTPVQLMWVNLIQDTLAALALATDSPSSAVLDRKPEPKKAPLITATMWKMIIGQSVYQLGITLLLHYGGDRIFRYHTTHEKDQLATTVFNTYVWMQIFNQYNCRRIDNKFNILEGVHRNWLFFTISVIMIGTQILVMFVGGAAFSITRLDGAQWAYSVILGVISIPVGFAIRLVPFEVLGRHFRCRWGWRWRWRWRAKRDEDGTAVNDSDGNVRP